VMSKDSLARKIRGLLNKTVENGATEEEAALAARKAREIMDEHQIGMTEVELREEGVRKVEQTFHGSVTRRVAFILMTGVEELTETTAWASPGNTTFTFLGLESDIIFAEWLLPTLVGIITRDAVKYARDRRDRSLQMSFATGAANRVSDRMSAEAAERRSKRAGTGLVVAKNAMINAELRALRIELKNVYLKPISVEAEANRAGQAAGDRIRWDKPVEHEEQLKIT
jgi:hypothetical protein